MNSDIKDKQFIALELTKILFSYNDNLSVDNISKAYTEFLKELTRTMDDVETINALKRENVSLQKENQQLKANNLDILKPFCERLLEVLRETQGDMEPYVYTIITTMINDKIR